MAAGGGGGGTPVWHRLTRGLVTPTARRRFISPSAEAESSAERRLATRESSLLAVCGLRGPGPMAERVLVAVDQAARAAAPPSRRLDAAPPSLLKLALQQGTGGGAAAAGSRGRGKKGGNAEVGRRPPRLSAAARRHLACAHASSLYLIRQRQSPSTPSNCCNAGKFTAALSLVASPGASPLLTNPAVGRTQHVAI